jgi:hypothetical protein
MEGIIRSWGRILAGYSPSLSIEITRECPLRCPGCYAYGDEHLGGGVTLREVRDLRGQALVDGVLALVTRHRPVHLSIVGGEPLVRYRELNELLPAIAAMGVHTQVVTSAVRPIPESWASIPRLYQRVNRRPAARARRPARAGHLRPYPEAHGRTPDHRALHGHAAAVAARRLPATSSLRFWSARPEVRKSGSASTRRRSARSRPRSCCRKTAAAWWRSSTPCERPSRRSTCRGSSSRCTRRRPRHPTRASSRA